MPNSCAPRGDAQARHVREGIDQFFGHAFAEVVLVAGRAHVHERQDRNRSRVVRRRRCRVVLRGGRQLPEKYPMAAMKCDGAAATLSP